MWRRIRFDEHSNEEGRIHWIDLEIDDQRFEMNRDDLFTLQLILDTVYDRMIPTVAYAKPQINHEIVKEKCTKTPVYPK